METPRISTNYFGARMDVDIPCMPMDNPWMSVDYWVRSRDYPWISLENPPGKGGEESGSHKFAFSGFVSSRGNLEFWARSRLILVRACLLTRVLSVGDQFGSIVGSSSCQQHHSPKHSFRTRLPVLVLITSV